MKHDDRALSPIKGVSTIYPVDIRNALVHAGQTRDIELINLLTDSLARQGLCRLRRDDVIQPAHVAAARGLG